MELWVLSRVRYCYGSGPNMFFEMRSHVVQASYKCLEPPVFASRVLGLQVRTTMLDVCGAGDQTEGFVPARQALY